MCRGGGGGEPAVALWVVRASRAVATFVQAFLCGSRRDALCAVAWALQELFSLCSGHRNIVELVEFREIGHEYYFVMEFCPSHLLKSVLEENKVRRRGGVSSCVSATTAGVWSCIRRVAARCGVWSFSDGAGAAPSLLLLLQTAVYSEAFAASAISQTAMALQHIHAKGVCHLDIKPDNLLLSSSVTPATAVRSRRRHVARRLPCTARAIMCRGWCCRRSASAGSLSSSWQTLAWRRTRRLIVPWARSSTSRPRS